MTNDIKHLEESKSIYCMFLNTKDRILYDTLVYSSYEPGNYLIECDSACSKDLASHLTRFRVRSSNLSRLWCSLTNLQTS
jgi:folate-binding Fe-S cluster repair protein YgfZ